MFKFFSSFIPRILEMMLGVITDGGSGSIE